MINFWVIVEHDEEQSGRIMSCSSPDEIYTKLDSLTESGQTVLSWGELEDGQNVPYLYPHDVIVDERRSG